MNNYHGSSQAAIDHAAENAWAAAGTTVVEPTPDPTHAIGVVFTVNR